MASVEGYWYGTYRYTDAKIAGIPLSARPPDANFRIEIVVAPNGKVSGTVADEIGYDRPATIDGAFDGRTLSFIKRYAHAVSPSGSASKPVVYLGTLSDDGTILSGTWEIKSRVLLVVPVSTSGIWQATRYVPAT